MQVYAWKFVEILSDGVFEESQISMILLLTVNRNNYSTFLRFYDVAIICKQVIKLIRINFLQNCHPKKKCLYSKAMHY